uniref:Uncharacterized protein n=1 Tax=Lepeophtheirus salmonis TaxID=72036 RepID=A0A0K2VKW1_LEPSM
MQNTCKHIIIIRIKIRIHKTSTTQDINSIQFKFHIIQLDVVNNNIHYLINPYNHQRV